MDQSRAALVAVVLSLMAGVATGCGDGNGQQKPWQIEEACVGHQGVNSYDHGHLGADDTVVCKDGTVIRL